MTSVLDDAAESGTKSTPRISDSLGRIADRAQLVVGRCPLLFVVVLAVLSSVVDWVGSVHEGSVFPADVDGSYFAGKGSILLGRHALNVFSDEALQSGPWQLLAWRGVAVVGGPGGTMLSECLVVAVCAVAVYVCTRWLLGAHRRRELLSVGVVFLLVCWGAIPEAFDFGHLSQVAIPLMWLVAAQLAGRRQALAAGVILGLSAGVETWGVLGVGLLLLLPGLRRQLVGAGAFAAVVLGTYLPFVLGGQFNMFQHHWVVSNQTLTHFLIPVGDPFTYQLRVLQTLAAVGLSAVVIWRLRGFEEWVWLVVVVPVAVRLMLDAQVFDYYVIPLRIAGAIGVAGLLARRHWVAAAVVGAATALVFTNGLLPPWLPMGLFAVAAVGVQLWLARGQSMGQTGDNERPPPQDARSYAETL